MYFNNMKNNPKTHKGVSLETPDKNTSSPKMMVTNEGLEFPINQYGAYAVPRTSSGTTLNRDFISPIDEAKATENVGSEKGFTKIWYTRATRKRFQRHQLLFQGGVNSLTETPKRPRSDNITSLQDR